MHIKIKRSTKKLSNTEEARKARVARFMRANSEVMIAQTILNSDRERNRFLRKFKI
jgi:hypothetical protein